MVAMRVDVLENARYPGRTCPISGIIGANPPSLMISPDHIELVVARAPGASARTQPMSAASPSDKSGQTIPRPDAAGAQMLHAFEQHSEVCNQPDQDRPAQNQPHYVSTASQRHPHSDLACAGIIGP
jgi:hypothetical protein